MINAFGFRIAKSGFSHDVAGVIAEYALSHYKAVRQSDKSLLGDGNERRS